MPPELIAPAMGHADTRMVERVYGRFTQNKLISRMKAAIGSSDSAADHPDSVPPSGLPGLGAPFGEPCFAGISVPRDGVEPPTRGFSIPSSFYPNPRKTWVRRTNGQPAPAIVQRAAGQGKVVPLARACPRAKPR